MASDPLTPRLAQILQEIFLGELITMSCGDLLIVASNLQPDSSTWARLIYELSENESQRSVRRRVDAVATLRPKAPMPMALPRGALLGPQFRRPTLAPAVL